MITIKVPYTVSSEDLTYIKELQRVQSSVMRFVFNRISEGMVRKEIDLMAKSLFGLDSWFRQSAYIKAKGLYTSNGGKKIFGGKHNFYQRLAGKISNEEYKESRLMPLHIEGESPQKGNRKFELNILNNSIIFKPIAGKKIEIKLPKLRKTYKKHLTELESLASNKQIPYTIELSQKFIYISFEINELKRIQNIIKRPFTKGKVRIEAKKKLEKLQAKIPIRNSNRVLGIDMNPNNIGISIIEFDSVSSSSFNIVYKEQIDFYELNKNTNDRLYSSNKKKFELIESIKYIVNLATYYNVSKIIIEDLKFKTGDRGIGKNFNRLTLNVWHRNLMMQQLDKRCSAANIDLVAINAAYSSTVGNVLYGNITTPDAIAASIEIARRGFKKYEKKWFYPELPSNDLLANRWKEALVDRKFGSWIELHRQIKNLKLRYRVPLDKAYAFAVFRHKSHKSKLDRIIFN